jgi:YD repeat-containing protein
MAIKKQLVADSGILSQGTGTFSNTVTIAGATSANGVTANTVAVTNGVTANTIASNTVSTVTTTSNTFSGNSVTLGSTTANTTAVNSPTINATSIIATTANVGTLNSTGLANVASANIAGSLNVGGATTMSGNVVVNGTLTVQGGVTTITSTQMSVADNIITLNSDYTTAIAPTENAGIEIKRGNASDVGIRWNETSDVWEASDSSGTYARIRRTGETIALGSETTGNYVASATGSGNGLTVSGAGAGAAVTVSIAAANTSTVGTVQLIDSILSANVTTAATPNSVKTAYDAAVSANTLAASKVASVSGTTGRITSSGGTAPAIDLATVVTAGANKTKVSYDAYGRVTAGSDATTTDIGEGTNLYFTNARARAAHSQGTGIIYDSVSGTITNADPGSSQLFFKSIANTSGVVQFAATANQDTMRFANGAGITIAFTSATKSITVTNSGVTGFNTRTGAVTLTQADVTDVLGSYVSTFNTRSGAVTLTSSDVTTALGYTPVDPASSLVTTFNTRSGTVTLSSADVTTALGYTPADSASGIVSSFNTRSGAVTLTSSDVTTALGYTPPASAVSSFNTRTGAVSLTSGDVTGALGFTPASTSAASLTSGTISSARVSGSYNSITSVGTLDDLNVSGNAGVGGGVFAGSGAATNPTFSFSSDGDTGMYRVGTNQIGWATAGSSRMTLSTSTLSVSGSITATGTVTGSSDQRLKKDITPITPEQGLNAILGIEPVTFTRIADNSRSSGYVAQQFMTVAPEQVIEDENGYLAIDVVGASPYHTAAIQYLVSQVNDLRSRLERIEQSGN